MPATLSERIAAARNASDWDLHAKLWAERCIAEVEADEASIKSVPATRKEAKRKLARQRREDKATRYQVTITWQSGNVEPSAAFGSLRNAQAWARKQKARIGIVSDATVIDRFPLRSY